MAFILRGTTRVLLNALQQVQGRTVSFNFNVSCHHPCIPSMYHTLNTRKKCRNICNIHTSSLQSEDSFTAAISENLEEKHEENRKENCEENCEENLEVNQNQSDEKQSPARHDGRTLPMTFKTKSSFLNHFHEQLAKGEVLDIKEASAMVKCCGRKMFAEKDSTRNKLLEYVWSELENNGVSVETELWNALMSVYIENKFNFEPLDVLKGMQQKSNSEPNNLTFSLLMQAYAAQGDTGGALKIVEFMIENGREIKEYMYGHLIQAFVKSGNMSGVDEVFRLMRVNNIQPRHATYGHLINAHAERGDLESINKTIQEMTEHGVNPTLHTYINLLDHLSIGGHTDLMEEIWMKIEEIGFLTEDFKLLIQQCVGRGEYKAAFILLKKSNLMEDTDYTLQKRLFHMLKFRERDITDYVIVTSSIEDHLNTERYSRIRHIIEFLVAGNEDVVAINFLKSLLADKKPVTTQMFHPILRNYGKEKRFNEVIQVYELMVDQGVPLDYVCFELGLPSFGERTSNEYQLFLQLIQNNEQIILPNKIAFEILRSEDSTLSEVRNILCIASTKVLFASLNEIKNKIKSDFHGEDAVEILCVLHKRGMNCVETYIHSIISHLIIVKDSVEDVWTFMKGLLEKNIPVDPKSYTVVLKMMYRNDMIDEFFTIVQLMKSSGIDPDVHLYYQMLKLAGKIGNSTAARYCVKNILNAEDHPFEKGAIYYHLIRAYVNEDVQVPPGLFKLRNAYRKSSV